MVPWNLKKAIEFLLGQQAKHDAHLAKNDQQIAQILEATSKLERICAGERVDAISFS